MANTHESELPTLCANCEDCGEPILPEYSHCDRCARSAGENDASEDCNCGVWNEVVCPMHGVVRAVRGE